MKNKILCGIIFCLLSLWCSPAIFSDDAESAGIFYQAGLAEIKQNNHQKAIEKFIKALSFRPGFPEALFKLGECYEKIKDNRKALRSYRKCLKALQQKSSPTAEERDLTAQVTRCLDKIDLDAKRLSRLKADYAAGLFKLANECNNKRYPRFACRVLERLLRFDPIHKGAQELIVKLDEAKAAFYAAKENKPEPTKPVKGKVEKIFNGKDMSNWQVTGNQQEYQLWRVENSQLAGGTKMGNLDCFAMYKGEVPQNYKLSLRYCVDRVYASESNHLGIVYSSSRDVAPINSSSYGAAGKLEFIRQGDKGKFIINGKVLNDNITVTGSPTIGLMVKNSQVFFSNITLEELK